MTQNFVESTCHLLLAGRSGDTSAIPRKNCERLRKIDDHQQMSVIPSTPPTAQKPEAFELLSAKIGELRTPDRRGAAALTLLNLIPYAGGAIAAVVGEYGSSRRLEKICDVLSGLNDALERRGVRPEKYLTKDQIIELVHESLQAAATTSDEMKIQAFKNGLCYAMTENAAFADKQLFLSVLRDLTSHEIALFQCIYGSDDPYRSCVGATPSLGFPGSLTTPAGFWRPKRTIPGGDLPPLMKFLNERLRVSEMAVAAGLRMLDSKGLADSAPHLNENYRTEYVWVPGSLELSSFVQEPVFLRPADAPKATPLSLCQTEFGKKFLNFMRG